MNYFEMLFNRAVRDLGLHTTGTEIRSAINEMFLLQNIEVNHPSKPQTKIIPVQFADPLNPGRMVEYNVEHRSRVLLDEKEVEERRELENKARTIARDPALLEAFEAFVKQRDAAKRPKRSNKPAVVETPKRRGRPKGASKKTTTSKSKGAKK